MKLIGEQVKHLRERQKELGSLQAEYQQYVAEREKTSIDDVGCPMVGDFSDDMLAARSVAEANRSDILLRNSEYILKRNLDRIDIGTGFYVIVKGRGKKRRFILTDDYSPSLSLQTVSKDTDFGQAVVGKTAGDEVTYTVQANGRTMTAYIDSIDQDMSHYDTFIREKGMSQRMSKSAIQELRELKVSNPEEYQKRHAITLSQRVLIQEELLKIPAQSKDYSDVRRRNFYEKLLELPIAEKPIDDSVGIGSLVTILLTDENGNTQEEKFEMINRAVSTELAAHYVERISPLGSVLYGLNEGDTFELRRNHLPRLQGMVTRVYNYHDNRQVKMKQKEFA